MRFKVIALTILILSAILAGCISNPEKLGLAYSGETRAENVRFLVDETWVDTNGVRFVNQEIFDSIFEMIDQAEEFVLIDLFLMNEWGFEPGPCMRAVGSELTDRLVQKRKTNPEVEIIFITDPVNTMYGAIESPQFSAMANAGIQVVYTDLDKLRDSNPVYSKPWRLLVRPWGVGPGRALKNPMGEERVSMRSMFKMLNFKANHRKIIITDKSLLLTSANPHSASSAHRNVALRVDGAGMAMGCEMESAVLQFSGGEAFHPLEITEKIPAVGNKVELLSEIRIKEKVLALLETAEAGARVDLCMFYMSEKDVVKAFGKAKKRGVDVRIILDPSKDSFGKTKNGVPNRQTAARLVKAGIPLRWADTHGEQCHIKMIYVEHADGTATLLLGSCNYTRRNMNNFNCEANIAFSAPVNDPALSRAREAFDRWWNNEESRIYTADYETYRDGNWWRKFSAWWGERTGMNIF